MTPSFVTPFISMQTFEEKIKQSLYQLLLQREEVDELLPETVDIEQLWPKLGEAYIPDGIREFEQYPTVSLGWMMYVGMAVAAFWDEDWTFYGRLDNLYLFMRDKGGYDLMDEYIRGTVLKLKQPEYDATESLARDCAELVHNLLRHEGFEPGTEAAFRGYVSCLHQLYLMGAAVQLHRMGYHMCKVEPCLN